MQQAEVTSHRSYSQAKQLRTCSWQYYLERVVKAPSRPSAPAEAGKAVHVGTEKVDELLLHGNTDPNSLSKAALSVAYAHLDEAIEQRSKAGWEPSTWKYFGSQSITWFRQLGIRKCVDAYIAWRLETQWVIPELPGFGPCIELPVQYMTTTGRLVHGYIDRLFVDGNGELVVLDIKTGDKKWIGSSEQLGVYAAAIKDGLGWDISTGYFLYGLKHGLAKMEGPLDLTTWTAERLGRLYENASVVIEQELFIPNPGSSCFVCSVSEHCEFARTSV